MPKPIYDFSTLSPEAKRWLFTQICAFDIGANDLAAKIEGLIVSVRMELLVRAYRYMENDDRLIICHLQALSTMNGLNRYSFDKLNPETRWVAALRIKLVELVVTDIWTTGGLTESQIRTKLMAEAKGCVEDCTDEEINLYFSLIDKWISKTERLLDLAEVA